MISETILSQSRNYHRSVYQIHWQIQIWRLIEVLTNKNNCRDENKRRIYIYIERKTIVAYDDGNFSISVRTDNNTRQTVNRLQSIVCGLFATCWIHCRPSVAIVLSNDITCCFQLVDVFTNKVDGWKVEQIIKTYNKNNTVWLRIPVLPPRFYLHWINHHSILS